MYFSATNTDLIYFQACFVMAFKSIEKTNHETEENKVKIYLSKGNFIKKVAKAKQLNVTYYISSI